MRKIVMIAMLLIASLISASEMSPQILAERLHVCTVASWMHPNLKKLITSCERGGIELEILGMDEPYRCNTDKLRVMKKYCDQLPDDDLVLFVDAFDVLILADQREIVSRFLALNVPMLMSAEMNCWPSKATARFHLSTPSRFKYINTGGYIGWVKAVRRWLDAFDKTLLSEASDQKAAHKLFAKNPHLYVLDHWCTIFLCLFGVPMEAVCIDAASGRITCTYTNSSPCVVHANGGSFAVWDRIYDSVFD